MTAPRRGVLIVGAGPTGLTLANCLARYGVPFQLVEKNSGLSPDSKALAINVLSQESFGLLGLQHAIGKNGCRVTRLNVKWKDTRLLPVDLRLLQAEPGALITQPQRVTEQELLDSLPAGVSPRWETELRDVRDEGDFVIARLRDQDGQEWEEEYDFVVGCEGKHSLVRRRLGATFDGAQSDMHFVLGDFPVGWDAPRTEAHYFAFDEVFFVVAPVSQTHFRFVVKRDGLVDPGELLRPEHVEGPVGQYLGKHWIAGPPSWLSRAPFYMRTANCLRRGRLVICGDAAHLYSPIGGTGMNTGMQDAFNLAWKLAYVLHGYAKDELLDTYETERREVIERTAVATESSTRLLAGPDRSPEDFSRLLPALRNRRGMKRLSLAHSGLAVSYSRSAAVSKNEDLAIAGTFHRGAGSMRRLLDVGAPPNSVSKALLTDVLVLATTETLARRKGELNELGTRLRALPTVRYSAVPIDEPRGGAGTGAAVRSLVRDARHATEGIVSIVRPDGFIAMQSSLAESAGIVSFLNLLHGHSCGGHPVP